jgi:hypothetical protein
MKSTGIILFGSIQVGSFSFSTAEDCFGCRELSNVKLQSNYFNLAKCQSEKSLNFMWVDKKSENNYILLEDFGAGTIYGNVLANIDYVELKLAKWLKKPKMKGN